MTTIRTPEDIRALPVGTEFVSRDDCLWAIRYAGKAWRKLSHDGVLPLDPADRTVTSVTHFKDPLPAEVVIR